MKRLTVFTLIAAEQAVKALADADYFSPQDSYSLAIWINRVEPVLMAARKAQLSVAKQYGAVENAGQWKVPDANVPEYMDALRDEPIAVQLEPLDSKILEQSRLSPGHKSLLIPFI